MLHAEKKHRRDLNSGQQIFTTTLGKAANTNTETDKKGEQDERRWKKKKEDKKREGSIREEKRRKEKIKEDREGEKKDRDTACSTYPHTPCVNK